MHTASRRTILRSIAALLAADFARGDTKHSRRFPFVQWDVFSKVRLAGNPLVVFPDARGLSYEEMQAITREIHQQETTFVIPREPRVEDKEGIRVRIFLPTKEVPFAGHPSLGTAMALQALWKQRNLPLRKVVRLALNVGQVPVTFRQEADGLLYGEMEQPDPQFSSAHDPSAVAPLLGLQSGDIDTSLPIQLVSTGLPYVLVPLKSRDAISKISIDWTRALPWLERVDPDALAALDAATKAKIIDDLRAWNQAHLIPILYVTHSREEVFALGERILVLDAGHIVAQGAPHEVIAAPQQETVAQLVGFENIFDATVESVHPERGTMSCRIAGEGGPVVLETPLVRGGVGAALD